MNRRYLCLLLPIFLGGVCLSSFAGEQPPVPDEFAVSQSISMTDQDKFYISPSASYFHFGSEKDVTVEADMAYGFTDRLGIELDVPYEFVNADSPSVLNPSQNGLNDISIQARYGVVDYRQHPFGLDVDLGFTLPTGVRPNRLVVNVATSPFQDLKVFQAGGLGEGQVNIVPAFTVSQWLGHFNLQANFAWLRPISNGGAGPNNEYQYNVTLAYAIHHWFLVVEGNGDSTSQNTTYYVTPELIWKTTEHAQVLLGVPLGVTNTSTNYGIIAGFTVEFENIFHRHAENQSDKD